MKKLLLLLGILLFINACEKDVNNPPLSLKVEYGSQIVDTETPRFSWILSDTSRGANQSAYQILISSTAGTLNEKNADTWNTGKVDSDQSVFVSYNGEELESGKRYYWTVRVWDNNGRVSDWSETALFDMAFFDSSKWEANWIGAYESEAKVDSLRPRSILLRKNFKLKKNVRLAKVYVTGLGTYQLFINGKKVSADLLTPGWTDYPTRVLYQVYDLSNYLRKGTNAAGVILGNMWYSSGLGWQGGVSYSKGPLMALMQIEIEYVDGSTEIIISDDSWKWNFSPIVENTLYHGESYDARMEIDAWNEASFDDSAWDQADKFEKREAILSAHTSPPIRITRELEAKSIKKLENGSYVFDMGKNITGGIRLTTKGKAGNELVMKFAELLHEDGSVAQENLRSAKATDKYILKGGETETWEPSFTYHGFRYVEISGLTEKPDSLTVIGLNYHNAAPETGSFKCSNDLINKIQANIQNGQRSNMFSVPTDCPQRDERLGWMGDAQIFAATSCYNMDMSGFYAKWIRDIADSQDDEGWVTDVNPGIVVTGPAKPAWGDAFTIVPWEMYRFYGDEQILAKFYPDYKEWVEYMRNNTEKDGLYIYDHDGWGGYADWIAVVESPQQPISAAYYFYSTKLLARFAEILGYENDRIEYESLASGIQSAFQKRYFDSKNASYTGGTQTALLLPVNFGLAEENRLAEIVDNLNQEVVGRSFHPSTGFLGTKYLLPTLSNFGYHQTAYKTATGTDYPSWGYMVKNGASSMWELWNSDTEPPEGMNSRNHFALGSVGEWYYSHLAGIQIDENNPAFKHSIIAPMPAEGLSWVEAKILTPYGTLESNWKKEKDIFTFDVTVPPNTRSTIKVPIIKGSRLELYESKNTLFKDGKFIGESANISFVEVTEDAIVLNVRSGKYTFEELY